MLGGKQKKNITTGVKRNSPTLQGSVVYLTLVLKMFLVHESMFLLKKLVPISVLFTECLYKNGVFLEFRLKTHAYTLLLVIFGIENE